MTHHNTDMALIEELIWLQLLSLSTQFGNSCFHRFITYVSSIFLHLLHLISIFLLTPQEVQ